LTAVLGLTFDLLDDGAADDAELMFRTAEVIGAPPRVVGVRYNTIVGKGEWRERGEKVAGMFLHLFDTVQSTLTPKQPLEE
jgi:hypothetical protein